MKNGTQTKVEREYINPLYDPQICGSLAEQRENLNQFLPRLIRKIETELGSMVEYSDYARLIDVFPFDTEGFLPAQIKSSVNCLENMLEKEEDASFAFTFLHQPVHDYNAIRHIRSSMYGRNATNPIVELYVDTMKSACEYLGYSLDLENIGHFDASQSAMPKVQVNAKKVKEKIRSFLEKYNQHEWSEIDNQRFLSEQKFKWVEWYKNQSKD